MPTETTYDSIVVGAGPAGARTAEVLARRGLHVAMVERAPEPGAPVRCTGIVSTEC
jgi:digeranylgeranylglycerophospholipid reductase